MNITKETLMDYFCGTKGTPIEKCARLAYGDLRRTLRGIGKKEGKDRQVDIICELIATCIEKLLSDGVQNQIAFDEWHTRVCEKIIDSFDTFGFEIYYGQAQKWLNMTFKNMLIFELNKEKMEENEKYLHVPVDTRILNAAAKLEVRIKKPQDAPGSWSRWKKEDYEKYQKNLRNNLSEIPIVWEFTAWKSSSDAT